MGEARQHHFIPQCYLKGFTRKGSKNSRLHVVEIATGRTFETTPKKVGKERDFNRIDGLPAGDLDNKLSGFETQLAKALQKIATARNLEHEDSRIYLLNLIGMIGIRNPRHRETFRRFQEEISRSVLDIALDTPERWKAQMRKAAKAGHVPEETSVTYEQVKDFHERGAYKIEVSTTWHTQLEFGAIDKVLHLLFQRRWLLCIAPADSGGFVTSDHPVCLLHSDGKGPTFRNPIGYGTANSSVIFPINRELAVVGTFEGNEGVRHASPKQVAYLNSVFCGYADRQVYSTDGRFRVMVAGGQLVRGSDFLKHPRGRIKSSR
jgi:hypothetical protein